MSGSNKKISEILSQIAQGQVPSGTQFSIKRIRQAGTPLFWEETISIELGGKSRYTNLRSFVNAGGWPIGTWEGQADEKTIRDLANALLKVKFLDIESKPVAPGGDFNSWECTGPDGEVVLSSDGSPKILRKMSPVDKLFRRIANKMIASRNGAALNCQIVIQPNGPFADVQVALVNEGTMDFQIQNSLKSTKDNINFLRVEKGGAPEEVPGMTGSDIYYQPLPIPKIDILPAPWDQFCIVLKAGEKLVCPFTLQVDLTANRGHYLRAIYSTYDDKCTQHDLPLIRGRVFSEETQLQ